MNKNQLQEAYILNRDAVRANKPWKNNATANEMLEAICNRTDEEKSRHEENIRRRDAAASELEQRFGNNW
jgi:hypothetical protein